MEFIKTSKNLTKNKRQENEDQKRKSRAEDKDQRNSTGNNFRIIAVWQKKITVNKAEASKIRCLPNEYNLLK